MRARKVRGSLFLGMLLASLAGCNAIVGNQDITYVDPSPTSANGSDDENPGAQSPSRSGSSGQPSGSSGSTAGGSDAGVGSNAGSGIDAGSSAGSQPIDAGG